MRLVCQCGALAEKTKSSLKVIDAKIWYEFTCKKCNERYEVFQK